MSEINDLIGLDKFTKTNTFN